MQRAWSLSTKLGAIGSALLLVALLSIGLTLHVTWQLEGGAAAVNEAGRMRMQTWRLAQTLASADAAQVTQQVQQFDDGVQLLRNGDPSRPLFVPQDAQSQHAFANVQAAWQALRQSWLVQPMPASDQAAAQAQAMVEKVDQFVSAIEAQLAWLTAALNLVQFTMVGLAIVSAVTLLYSAYLFVFNPLTQLQAGLKRAGEGDLSARVDVGAKDEFGALGQGFNQMAQTLQGLYQSLESKVQEKTLYLDQQRTRLAALYEAADFATRAASLQDLAQGFAKQLRRVARADACAVRWADESNQRYLLLASDCLAQAIVDEEQCLPTAACLCGQAQAQAQTRVIPIQAQAQPGQRSHCQKAGYQTIISLPLRLQERLVGEVDLFFISVATMSTEDRALLETLASHLAGAIEGLRAQALQREAAVAEERALLARELHDSIAQSLVFLKIQAGLMRTAVERSDATALERTMVELDEGVRESLADVRELLLHFRTRTNAEDVAHALKATLQKFEHQTGLNTWLQVEGDGLPLAPDVQVQVLHVVQEALSNVRKHAGAQQVWVEVQQSPQWRVEVRDDGCGFAPGPSTHDQTHVGLKIMQERAAKIGATVHIDSVPGAGTCVVLTLTSQEAMPA